MTAFAILVGASILGAWAITAASDRAIRGHYDAADVQYGPRVAYGPADIVADTLARMDAEQQQAAWLRHVEDAVEVATTPTYDATAAHIAHMEAAELDDADAVARWLS